MSWEKVKLGDIVDIKKGTYITKNESKEGPYPVILGGKEPAYYIDRFNHTGKAIVISRSGASAGYVSFWNEPIFVTDGFLIEPKEKVDFDFLYYLLKSHQPELQGKQGGAAIPHVNPRIINAIEVVLPPLFVQRNIANVLSAYDDLIENNQKQIKLLEEAAQRLYKEWFVDLRFPGYENTEIIDGVPEGWRKDAVGNLIDKSHRSKQVKSSEYLNEGKIPVVDQGREFISGYTNDEETIVDLGCPIIVFGDHTRILKYIQFPFAKGADGTQLIVSVCDEMPQSLLYCSLINVDLSNFHYARHFKYLKAEEILVPDTTISKQFDNVVSSVFKQVQCLRDQVNKLKEARDRLLPKLMSGELEV
ncbi:MAG: restriction endonuclease subunit S [Clostridia bacterium]|nr:restriction endonuclease subunit S [Clostridia bacterium]